MSADGDSGGCDGDVRQDYYVYVHRDRESGVPFYVGKGVGQRAYRRDRNELWKKKVDSLAKGYDVEIVKANLTESDAQDLEICQILKYKRIEEGGTLVNKSAGDGIVFAIGIPFEDEGNVEYEKASYPTVTRERKHEFAQETLEELQGFSDAYDRIVDETKDDVTDLEESLGSTIAEIQDSAERIRKRTAVYQQLCWDLEQGLESLEYDLELFDGDEEDKALVALATQVAAYLKGRVVVIRGA